MTARGLVIHGFGDEEPGFHLERGVLGAAIRHPYLAWDLKQTLGAYPFTGVETRKLFAALKKMPAVFDAVALADALQAEGHESPAAFISECLDAACTDTMFHAHVATLKERAEKRRRRAAIRDANELIGQGKDAEAAAMLRGALEEPAENQRATNPLLLVRAAGELVPETPPAAIVERILVGGHSFKSGGTLAIATGDKGLGKTWFALDAARRISRGLPIGPLQTVPTPAAVFTLEADSWETPSRRDAISANPEDWRDVFVVDKSALYGVQGKPYKIHDEDWQNWTIGFLLKRKIGVWFLDPIGRAVRGEASLLDDAESGDTIAILERIALESGVAVWIMGHKPKPGPLSPKKRSAFGSFRWEADPRTVASFDEVRGTLCLSFDKAHAGSIPDPIYYEGKTWPLVDCDPPEDAAEAKQDRKESVLSILAAQPGLTPGAVKDALDDLGHTVSEKSVQRYLRELREANRLTSSDGHYFIQGTTQNPVRGGVRP